jgi:hypothetical protein
MPHQYRQKCRLDVTGAAQCGIIEADRKAGGMSPQDIEKRIREINGTMAIEGMPLSDKDKDALRTVLRGEATYREMVERIYASASARQAAVS